MSLRILTRLAYSNLSNSLKREGGKRCEEAASIFDSNGFDSVVNSSEVNKRTWSVWLTAIVSFCPFQVQIL